MHANVVVAFLESEWVCLYWIVRVLGSLVGWLVLYISQTLIENSFKEC